MMAFIKSFDEKSWRSILTGWEHPFTKVDEVKTSKFELTWTTKEEKFANVNSKTLYAIFYRVDPQ
ncbi:hypothetical protein J1N35_018091 [Gossypium stocksii]|uniref:Gag-pol polyprotein n=1 Tax=Gossypium stocksii TaxID=47602 RepID=A0A9D4A5U3_9ROSI|nr:hypothetical protein J1N35_018091 [Gossypium stocksii]